MTELLSILQRKTSFLRSSVRKKIVNTINYFPAPQSQTRCNLYTRRRRQEFSFFYLDPSGVVSSGKEPLKREPPSTPQKHMN